MAEHWSSANVVQELGWRPRPPTLLRPEWRRKKTVTVARDPGETRLLVLFDVLHCIFLAWVASLIGLSSMSDGSLPWEWVLPAAAALSAGLLALLKGLLWPPVPEWERFPGATAEDPEGDEADEPETEEDAEPEEDAVLTVGLVLLGLLVLPLVVVLAVAGCVLVFGALLIVWVVRRAWPAFVVVALLAVVAPYASADDVGYTLFATGALAGLFHLFLVWPLQRWCGLPTPYLRSGRRPKGQVWEVASET